MFSWFNKKKIICPYCLAEIRSGKNPERCPACKHTLPVQYVHDYDQNPPFFAQVFGWSQVGKTVYLSALTLMLVKMSNIWPKYTHSAATDASQRKVQEINEYLAQGTMPPMTPLGDQEIYVMMLRNMERWGGRALVSRDCAGEVFDNLEVPIEQAPFLLNAPTTFMLISLDDLPKSQGRSMDMLMNNYINTLLKHNIDFKKEKRKLVVVFTKADKIADLPPNLRNYLIQDPLWAAVNARGSVKQMDAVAMQEYIEQMERVSNAIRDWIYRQSSGKTLIRLAEERHIDMRFSLISSTGSDPGESGVMQERLSPRRVLDPYFWALELQSR